MNFFDWKEIEKIVSKHKNVAVKRIITIRFSLYVVVVAAVVVML